MSNYTENSKSIDQFRKELRSMLNDISEIDIRVLSRAVNGGVAYAKRVSPVITGFYRKSWKKTPAIKSGGGVECELINSADYASFVNYGHRTVDKKGNTTGYVKSSQGDHLLEKTQTYIDRNMMELFEKEVKAVQKRHDK